MLKLLSRIIWEAFQWVGLFGGLLGLVTGLALIFNSSVVFRVSERMNVWISTRKAMRPWDQPIEVERAVYRAHRLVGILLLTGALFTLYVLLLRLGGPELTSLLSSFFRLPVAAWIATSVRIFLIVVNLAALFVAAAMLLRPSALKGLEAWANRSFSGRGATRAWEIPRPSADPIAVANPRLVGAALAVAGAYVVLAIGYTRFVA
jgi:hypothetical protein